MLENDNNLNSSSDESQKGILYKLISIKQKLNKKIEIVSNAESELNKIDSRIKFKLGKMSHDEREDYNEQYKVTIRWEKEYLLKDTTNNENDYKEIRDSFPMLNLGNKNSN